MTKNGYSFSDKDISLMFLGGGGLNHYRSPQFQKTGCLPFCTRKLSTIKSILQSQNLFHVVFVRDWRDSVSQFGAEFGRCSSFTGLSSTTIVALLQVPSVSILLARTLRRRPVQAAALGRRLWNSVGSFFRIFSAFFFKQFFVAGDPTIGPTLNLHRP